MTVLRLFVTTVLAAFMTSMVLTAQRGPAFEVASIKLNDSGEIGVNLGLPPGRFTATNVPLRELIRVFYGVPEQRLITPEWTANERFDIDAVAGGAATREQVFAMVRTLLAERFGVVVKNESRELPVYFLVRAHPETLGPRLRAADRDCVAIMARPRGSAPPAPRVQCGSRNTPITMVIGGYRMDQIAADLTGYVGRVVYDRTGLTGIWDMDLDFAPTTLDPSRDTPSDRPSIFAAVQEQLGLRLESARAPVDVLVVERVERPTPN